MLSILAILFLLLGTFTQQASANEPGTVTFTIDHSNYKYDKNVELMTVEIKGRNCGEPTIVPPTLNKSKQFTVNWKDCPGVNGAADLKDVVFHIKCIVSFGRENIFGDVTAELRKNTDEELKQIFAGGKATITFSANGLNNEIKHVVEETNTSALNGNPGPLTFTIDHSKLDKSAELIKVEIKRKGEECGEPTIAPPTLKESKQFTVNWKDCTEVKEAADLKDVEFHIQITITGPSGRIMATPRAGLSRSTDEELKQFYAGGKAKITINTNADNEVKYVVEDTNASHGNPGAFLTFTIDSKLSLPDPEAKIEKVQILQNGRECKQPTIISSDLNESKQFSVDHWKECPEEVKDAADLKHIGIVITYSFGPDQGNLMLPRVQLEDCSGYLLNKLLVGGHAKILISADGRNNEVKYVADKNGDPRILTFTVNPRYVLPDGSMAMLSDVRVLQKLQNCKTVIAPPNLNESKKFTVDWDDCPKMLNEFTDLDGIQIYVYFKQGTRQMQITFDLEEQSDGLLRHLFVGGEAEISISNEDGKIHKQIQYVKEPNGMIFASPGHLTFAVEYENREISGDLRDVTIMHQSKELGEFKPEIKDKDFHVDLLKCNVHDTEDLLDLGIQVRFSLKNPANPRRSQPMILSFPLSILKKKPENIKKFYKGGRVKLVFNARDQPTLTYDRPNPQEPNVISHLEGKFLTEHLRAFDKKILPGSSSHSSSNKPGTVKFTIHPQLTQKNAQLESVEIFQNDEEWKLTTVNKESMEFTVDWNNCPVKVKTVADLNEIEILVTFAGRRKLHYPVYLNKNNKDEELEKLFAGGEAKITIKDDGGEKHTTLQYVENPNAIGSSSHSSKGGTVKFTVHFKHAKQNAKFESVEIFHQKEDKECKTTNMKELSQFTVDWSECEEKLEKAEDLKEIEILVTFTHGRRTLTSQLYLKKHEDELEKLFAGGEAKITIDVPTKHMDVEISKSITAQQAILALNVEYANREGAFFDQVQIRSTIWTEDHSANCKPLLYEGGRKFSVDLAKCGVEKAEDVQFLIFEFHFLLDHAPGKQLVKTVTRSAILYGKSVEELEKYFNGGEAKLVFFDIDEQQAREFFANKGWKRGGANPSFSWTYLSAPNKPAPHQRPMKKVAGIELFVDQRLWQTKEKKKLYENNGRNVWGFEPLKIVNELNMKLRKHGVECPLRTANYRRRYDEFKFDIDWAECVPAITSSAELEGMALNITYQQGEKGAVKELHYQFSAVDPLKDFFDGNLEFRLVEYEHGKVRHQQSQGIKY